MMTINGKQHLSITLLINSRACEGWIIIYTVLSLIWMEEAKKLSPIWDQPLKLEAVLFKKKWVEFKT
jgi:hypothetical protein